MQSDAERVLTAALELSVEERWEVVEALIGSFQAPDRVPFDETWRAVIEQRSFDLESGSVTTLPWSEVKHRARDAAGE